MTAARTAGLPPDRLHGIIESMRDHSELLDAAGPALDEARGKLEAARDHLLSCHRTRKNGA